MARDERVTCRNVTIDGYRTSLRMENEVWDGLHDVCRREGLSVDELCSRIESDRDGLNRTSAIRAFVVDYLRRTAQRPANRRKRFVAIHAR